MFICSVEIYVIIHKMQGCVNNFCISMIGQFGFAIYTSFKYFPIIRNVSQLINWHNKYE